MPLLNESSVTLNRDDKIILKMQFKGGTKKSLHLPLPKCSWQQRVTPTPVV
jgi:hypothetical protein